MLDFVSPGGSMIAAAPDVGIFLRALNDGSLLSKDERPYIHLFISMSILAYHQDTRVSHDITRISMPL